MEEAQDVARTYWKRLCKWHNPERVTELFGHPVDKVKAMSQVSIFTDSESEDESYSTGEEPFSEYCLIWSAIC